MKKLLAVIICLILLVPVALADDYSSYSIEELESRRAELLAELSQVTSAYGEKVKAEELAPDTSGESLGSIESLFPDEQLAMFVRDKLNKFSISQPVTQAELDTIKDGEFGKYFGSGYLPTDFTGISHLRYLEEFSLNGRTDIPYLPDEICSLVHLKTLTIESTDVKALPENIGNLTSLRTIYGSFSDLTELPASFTKLSNLNYLQLCYAPIEHLPEDFGKLTSLTYFHIDYSSVKELPDSICNITGLKKLKVANTDISKLPENIGNLVNLETLDISNTKISSLPESIWGLTIKDLNMQGTTIK